MPIQGLDEVITALVASETVIVKVTASGLTMLGNQTVEFAKDELSDVRYTGALDSSFVVETDTVRLETQVYPTAPHSVYVREGTKPHWMPIGPLKAWAAAKLGDANLAYPVQRSIAMQGTSVYQLRKRGTKGNPWPERVIARGDFQSALNTMTERLGTQIEARIFA